MNLNAGGLAAFLGGSVTIYGTVSGGTLTLQLPGSNGTIHRLTMHSARVAAYNRDVRGAGVSPAHFSGRIG